MQYAAVGVADTWPVRRASLLGRISIRCSSWWPWLMSEVLRYMPGWIRTALTWSRVGTVWPATTLLTSTDNLLIRTISSCGWTPEHSKSVIG